LFSIRTLPARLIGRDAEPPRLTIDDIGSSKGPGFRILAESEREVVVGAIGKVWKLDIPFVEVSGPDAFARFDEPGYAKVAWALRALPRGERNARIEVEVRVSATDEESCRRFRRYFRFIGPGSRIIRRRALVSIARSVANPLPGDDLLPDAAGSLTHSIAIRAEPEAIWPWLVQMGCRRAGWYSYDALDNGGVASASEIRPELQDLAVGDVLPATPKGEDGFEVLRLEPPRLLLLGGLFDVAAKKQLPFATERPARYWQMTWVFVLERVSESETRLVVRARAAFPESGRLHALWVRPVHRFMQTRQLRNLKARAERSSS
jgi:hypothetical protein